MQTGFTLSLCAYLHLNLVNIFLMLKYFTQILFKKKTFFQISAVYVSRKLLLVNNYLLFEIKIQHFDLLGVHKQRMSIFSSTVLKHNVQLFLYYL